VVFAARPFFFDRAAPISSRPSIPPVVAGNSRGGRIIAVVLHRPASARGGNGEVFRARDRLTAGRRGEGHLRRPRSATRSGSSASACFPPRIVPPASVRSFAHGLMETGGPTSRWRARGRGPSPIGSSGAASRCSNVNPARGSREALAVLMTLESSISTSSRPTSFLRTDRRSASPRSRRRAPPPRPRAATRRASWSARRVHGAGAGAGREGARRARRRLPRSGASSTIASPAACLPGRDVAGSSRKILLETRRSLAGSGSSCPPPRYLVMRMLL